MATLKDHARTLCTPLLAPLERGDEPFHYAPKSRLILVIMCALFIFVDLGQPRRVLNVLLFATPNSVMFWDTVVLFGYLGLTTWVGHALRGKQATIRDFFLGGRSLPWPAVTGCRRWPSGACRTSR